MARKIVTEADIKQRKRGVVVGIAGGCAGLLVLVGIILLVLYLRVTGKPAPPREAQVASQAASQPVASIDQQVAAAQQQARPNVVQPVQLVVSSQDLTNVINRSVRGNEVQDLQVHLGEGTAAAQGRVNVDGRNLWMTLRFRPRAENGQVKLDLVDASVGSMPMPQALRAKVQAEMDKQSTGDLFGSQGMWVDSVSITQGRLYLQGRVQGR